MAYFDKRYHPPGTAPGTLAGDDSGAATVHLMDYSPDRLAERADATVAECTPALHQDQTVTWVHVQGRPHPELLQEIGNAFGLHHLAMEDVLNRGQRAKVEDYGGQLFVVLASPCWHDAGEGARLAIEQVSLFLGDHYVVSFAEGAEDPFEPVRQRLRGVVGRFRRAGADYLLYALVDLVVDQGFPALERLGDELEAVEDVVLDEADGRASARLHRLRAAALQLRRALWPQREATAYLSRDETALVHETTRLHLRDCHDHAVQMIEMLEAYREMATHLLDVQLTRLNHRLSESMRMLTIVATLFIPPTFIVGVYGMNFDPDASRWNMPELAWPFGYLFAWGVILMTIGLLFWWMRRRGL